MRFLMRYTLNIIEERNVYPQQITLETVEQMFRDVSDVFDITERSAQTHWESVVRRVRRQ